LPTSRDISGYNIYRAAYSDSREGFTRINSALNTGRRASNSPSVDGSSENVRNLSYPLSSYLYWTFPEKHGAAVAQLVQFTLSPRGQMAVEASGCYPLNPSERVKGMFALSMK
jgi:ABC-type phosphate transport system substrate-binding protein